MGQSPVRTSNSPAQFTGAGGFNDIIGQQLQGVKGAKSADLGGVNQAANAALNVNTSPMQQTAGQLAGFNPLGGAAGNTLQGIIGTGNATNVAPITQAAQQQAQMTFQGLMPQVNEQFGALGLGSSSAREAELGRQAANISTGVGIEGLRAGVGAQENAANRQLQAFNPLLQGSGQQLSGLQSAGGLQGQAAGLQLGGAQTAGNLGLGAANTQNAFTLGQLGAGQAAINPLLGTFGATTGSSLGGFGRPMKPGGGEWWQQNAGGAGAGSPLQGYMQGGQVPDYATGGRVDFGDFMSNLLFGQQFNRTDPRGGMRPVRQGPDGIQQSRARNMQERDRAQGKQDQIDLMNHQANLARAPRGGYDPYRVAAEMAAIQPANYRYNTAEQGRSLGSWLGAIGPQAAHQGLMQTGRLLASQGGTPDFGPMATQNQQRMQDQQIQGQLALQQGTNNQYLNMGLNPLTGQPFQGGGEVQGPSVPPDRVPINAQGGELIVPVGLRSEIEASTSTDPLVGKLKQLVGKMPGMEYGQMQAQHGAQIPQYIPTADPSQASVSYIPSASMTPSLTQLAMPMGGAQPPIPTQFAPPSQAAPSESMPGFVGPTREQGQVGFAGGQRSFSNADLGPEGPNAPPPGAMVNNPEEDAINYAKARLDLLSSLGMRAGPAARLKLSGMIEKAQGEYDTLAAQQRAQALLAQQFQQQSDLRDQINQGNLEQERLRQEETNKRSAANEQARTERETKAAEERRIADLYREAFAATAEVSPDAAPSNARRAVESFERFQRGEPEVSSEQMDLLQGLDAQLAAHEGDGPPEDIPIEIIRQAQRDLESALGTEAERFFPNIFAEKYKEKPQGRR